MTQAEFGEALGDEESRLTNGKRVRSESYVGKLLRGEIALTDEDLKIIKGALHLEPWEFDFLKEVADHGGFATYLAREMGVPVPNVLLMLQHVVRGELKIGDLRYVLDDWVRTAKEEQEKRVRTKLAAESDASLDRAWAMLDKELRDQYDRMGKVALDTLQNELREARQQCAELEAALLLTQEELAQVRLDLLRHSGGEPPRGGPGSAELA
jgi:hypothetical protein